MTKLSKVITTPEDFLEQVPHDPVKNIRFRQKIHAKLAEDPVAQKEFLELCYAQPQIAFDTCFFTYDPRQPVGYRNRPFILRPQQRKFVDALKDAIDNKHDLIADKSREEGATEVICKMFALYWMLVPDMSFLVGSRKEDLVDNAVDYKHGRLLGAHQSLFHKIMYAIVNSPVWMRPAFNKKHLFLQNLDNNSMIEGESTNESFGAGNRASAVLIDELARVEPEVAEHIVENIHDTSPTVIYNSTHFRWGASHVYSKLLRSNKVPVVTLGYEDNPEKNVGAYYSPIEDVVEIIDVDYYKKHYPEIFQYAENYKETE